MDHLGRVGRYVIEDLLGRGSMGTVYLAHDPVVDRRVALKVLGPRLGGGAGQAARERFLREARAAGRLSHPNIVTVFDVGEDPEVGLAFIAMDHVEGRTLQAAMADCRRLAFGEAAGLVATLAGALDYAHRKGVVHRDVKPANVILAAEGGVKLTDFGVARLDTSELTVEGTLLGTPSYMSPEQISGRPVDGRSDLYSLGVVLYELLTGGKPFVACTLPELSLAVTQRPPRDPRSLRPELPAPLAEVVLRCLAKQPEDRFQSGAELAEALASLDLEGATATGDVFGGSRERELPPLTGSVFAAPGVAGPTAVEAATLPTVRRPRTVEGHHRRRAALAGAILLGAVVLVTVVVLRGLTPGGPAASEAPALVESSSPTPLPTVPRPTPVPTAKVELVHRNRLGSADMSVWVDNTQLWSTRMTAAKNPVARVAGDKVRQSLVVPAGRHRLTVHIRGRSMEVDARAAIESDLRVGESRVLRVTLNPYSEKVTLTWVE